MSKNSWELCSDEEPTGTTDLARMWQSSSDFRVPRGGRPIAARLVCSFYGPTYYSLNVVICKLGNSSIGLASKRRESVIDDHLFPASFFTNWVETPSSVVHNLFATFIKPCSKRVNLFLPGPFQTSWLKSSPRR